MVLFEKKKSLKPEIFSIGTKQAGQGRRSIVPPEACLKVLGKFYPLLFYNCTSLARSTTSTPTWLRRNAWQFSQQQESSDQKTCSPGSLIRMLWRPPMKTWRDVIPPNKLHLDIREPLKILFIRLQITKGDCITHFCKVFLFNLVFSRALSQECST